MAGHSDDMYYIHKHTHTWAYGQIMLKAPVPARSPKLSNDEPVQYLGGGPFKK